MGDPVRDLELTVAELKSRVADHETDIRQIAPVVGSLELLRDRYDRMSQDMNSLHESFRGIVVRLDAEAKDRSIERERAREKERDREDRERRDRFIRNTTLATLVMLLISTTVGVATLL